MSAGFGQLSYWSATKLERVNPDRFLGSLHSWQELKIGSVLRTLKGS